MKKILGLDLGTTSIGWALVNQSENEDEKSSIIAAGVRVNPLSSDEKDCFEGGKDITTNATRRLQRSARRNLQRYKLRRERLIEILKQNGWIDNGQLLSEDGNRSTFETYRLRAKAATEEISLYELARVLLMLNKKRGYKSSRKAVSSEEDDGKIIDSMSVAKELYDRDMTPAEYCLELATKNSFKFLPDFYRSDLTAELDRIWETQSISYPEILTDDFRTILNGKGRNETSRTFYARYGITTSDNKGKDKKLQALKWRVAALAEQLPIETVAYVISDINGQISSSSGYLGEISDRSKILYFNRITVGQYLMSQLDKDPHFRVRNKVFYRQDYLDEFERIWETQASYHKELTPELKREIRDTVIFYQRRLKSQKSLISYCEFEGKKITISTGGKAKEVYTGPKVAPRSSLLFQEFKIWSVLNNVEVRFPDGTKRHLEQNEKENLAKELTIKDSLSSSDAAESLFGKRSGVTMNYKTLDGNKTTAAIFKQLIEIVNISGHGDWDIKKMKYENVTETITEVFEALGYNHGIINFDSSLCKERYEQQPLFKLWHLLYSYEGDNSKTGNASLIDKISQLCGIPHEYAKLLSGITFAQDYAQLSHKAISKILPYLKLGYEYSKACELAGYKHSKDSLTKEELESRPLVDHLPLLAKNSLRNPVVEKILNQMINVVNTLNDTYGKPDEIHIELARELKQTKDQRKEATKRNNDNQSDNDRITKILKSEFALSYVSKTDILRYKLFEELKNNAFKTLYSNRYITKDILFSRDIDIEHIIPQALLFDDSMTNKTLEFRDVNLEKGKMTAMDYVASKYGDEGVMDYRLRIEDMFKSGAISKGKRDRLLMKMSEIPSDFINRDLKDTQYIAKKAKEILQNYARRVMSTTGSVTAKLREDWRLVNVMQELNWDKYDKIGKTYTVVRGDEHVVRKISDWTKRNDHRHHALDAITIAFTKPSHIQYLNNLSASDSNESELYGIKTKETHLEGSKRVFNPPMPYDELRKSVKDVLESILVSIKAKNKVVTKNRNKSKTKNGYNETISLTPRDALHKESVYGKARQYETFFIPVNGKLTYQIIGQIASTAERDAIRKRLDEFGGDAKKAFTGKNSLDKNPVYLDRFHSKCIPEKVRCVRFRTVYTIRKKIDDKLNVSKVIDGRIRQLLTDRLKAYGDDPKKAFTNLDANPIWFNEAKGIQLKSVTISENLNLDALHYKRDKDNRIITDENGNNIVTDFVNLRNNHHAAIYKDSDGNYQEVMVSFFEAVNRANAGMPVIDKEYNRALGWEFLFSIKSNEMFVFPDPQNGFTPEDLDLTDPANYSLISPYLYRVQKISSKDYWFRHHLETTLEDDNNLKDITWRRITSLNKLAGVVKVRINHLGQIVSVGEQ